MVRVIHLVPYRPTGIVRYFPKACRQERRASQEAVALPVTEAAPGQGSTRCHSGSTRMRVSSNVSLKLKWSAPAGSKTSTVLGPVNQSHYPNGWAHSKVLWMAKPAVTGTVLIRGQQIDGPVDSPQWIGFGMGDVPELTLHWQLTSQTGWANLPSDVRIRAPGCYAYQVDSQGTSEVIVFQVVGVD
jgi:hypothetical protein